MGSAPDDPLIGKDARRNSAPRDMDEAEKQVSDIVDKATKLLGGKVDRADIEAELNLLDKARAALSRLRMRQSKPATRAVAQFRVALSSLRIADSKMPDDFRTGIRLGFSFDKMLQHLEVQFEAYANSLGKEVVNLGTWQKGLDSKPGELRPAAIEIKHGKPKRDAVEKELAAEAALRLFNICGLKSKTTKDGAFCHLAALLYRDPDANLEHQCRNLLKVQNRAKTVSDPR